MRVPRSLRDLMSSVETLVYIEDLSDKKGLMQAINPLSKLVAIAAMIISALFISKLSYLLVTCLLLLIFAVASCISLKRFFTRTLLIPMFMALISIPTLFLTVGNPLWTASVGGMNFIVTSEGVTRFLVFTVRLWFCVASINILILSTGFDKLLQILAALKTPSLIIQLFSLTYRYFFVSIHETQSVLIAKEARTYIKHQALNFQALKDLGNILSSLFIRTYERSERVYLAMKARGFNIHSNSGSDKSSIPSLHIKDVVFVTLIIIAFTYLAFT